ncbi:MULTISPECIES: efflux RND transporter periplasmic adaptor subunit [Paenibacillus]|uniref:efflux RND transporter periplasmic adaptor subunit n=1 Tax=Paenibacillus TaxID=44249 RepID=UPI002FDFDCE3
MEVSKRKWIIGVLLGIVVIGLVGVNLVNMNRALVVKTAEVTEGEIIEEIYTNGKLEPEKTTKLYSPVSGIVGELRIKAGDTVSKGQVLLTLKQDGIREQLAKERLSLEQAESERLQAKKQHFEAFKKSVSEDPNQDVEELDLTSFDLRIKSSKLTIASLEDKLANSAVYAPADGVITTLTADAGQMIAEGGEIAQISDLSGFKVRANLNELDAGKAAVGMKAVVTGESISGTYEGVVDYLAPTAKIVEATSKDATVEMTVRLSSKAAELRPGYGVTVAMKIPDKPRLLAQISAVQHEGDQAYVFTVQGGKAVKVPVQTGKEGDEQIEITKGVAKGDPVVVEGLESLKDGDKVTVQ